MSRQLSERFSSSLTFDDSNKPDTLTTGLGSPISPLRGAHTNTNTNTNTSSSSSSSNSSNAKSDGRKTHSCELSGSTGTSPLTRKNPEHHRRTGSGGVTFSTASSPVSNVLPTGNICPSGFKKPGLVTRPAAARTDVLGSGSGNYGHGSIMKATCKSPTTTTTANTSREDPQEVTRMGNECYKKGQYREALGFYDRAVEIFPGNAACHSNRAAAMAGMGRLVEAVKECEVAVRLDPGYGRAHHRLASLYLRLGQVESADRHLSLAGQQRDVHELRKLQLVEKHLGRCAEARKNRDWKSALREADAAIAAGADSSPWVIASRAEALLRLHQLDAAASTLSNAPKLETSSPIFARTKFFGMLAESYLYVVQAQIEMAFGRFESAVVAVEQARRIDSRSTEVAAMVSTVRAVARARAQGNELFKSGNYAEASTAYADGLKFDRFNPFLYCNRAACRAKLGQWDKSIEDCNEALTIHPSYTKALLRRANSYTKLERWAEAVRDYEVLRKELPSNTEVAESLFHAQVALKTSRGEEVSNMKFGGEVEEISSQEHFQAAISLPGVSVVYFMATSNQNCFRISPFVDILCTRYPSLSFLKVNVSNSPSLAKAENVCAVPTFKIYKNGARVKEIICPNQQVLETSVRHYGL